jgi:hypothetical protein
MYPHLINVILDGGCLRSLAKEFQKPLVHAGSLAKKLAESGPVQTWAYDPTQHPNALLARVRYYDALSNDPVTAMPRPGGLMEGRGAP